MKSVAILTGILVVAGGALLVAAHAAGEAPPDAPKVAVGVFDSRAVTIAYAHSEQFRKVMFALKARHDEATLAGDAKLAGEIEAEAKARQAKFHRQTFSTAPVDDILAVIADELPAIAKRAGVDLMVSKWQVAWRSESAKTVDVTRALIAPFKPNERALKIIDEMATKEPIPLEDLGDHGD